MSGRDTGRLKITHYATTLVMRRGELHTVQFPRERERPNDPSSPLLTCQGPNDFTEPQRKYLLFFGFSLPFNSVASRLMGL